MWDLGLLRNHAEWGIEFYSGDCSVKHFCIPWKLLRNLCGTLVNSCWVLYRVPRFNLSCLSAQTAKPTHAQEVQRNVRRTSYSIVKKYLLATTVSWGWKARKFCRMLLSARNLGLTFLSKYVVWANVNKHPSMRVIGSYKTYFPSTQKMEVSTWKTQSARFKAAPN